MILFIYEIIGLQLNWIGLNLLQGIKLGETNERIVPFLMKELSLLRNYLAETTNKEEEPSNKYSSDIFLNLFKDFFLKTPHVVNIPLVFATLCWSKSIICLQGIIFECIYNIYF